MATAYNLSVLVEVDATELFGSSDDNPNWRFCNERASFSHKEACEFIVHVGENPDREGSYFQLKVAEMREFGCTEDFIEAYTVAKKLGAERVLFHA